MLKEGQIRIPSGCAIAAIIDKKGNPINGSEIIKSIALMHDRSNGLGGGFAAYGIYPEHADDYAFHVFYDSNDARAHCEEYLFKHFNVDVAERIPTKKSSLSKTDPIFGAISASRTGCVCKTQEWMNLNMLFSVSQR